MRGLGNFDPAAQLIEVIDGKTYGDEGQYKFLAEGGTSMFRGLILISIVLIASSAGHAAELDGVTMPETRIIDGKQMQLNGIGLRTYSVLRIRIYVAGLYLERRSDNPDAILHSTESKLLDIRFLRDVDAENARKAWRDGFDGNCKLPCHLDPSEPEHGIWCGGAGKLVTVCDVSRYVLISQLAQENIYFGRHSRVCRSSNREARSKWWTANVGTEVAGAR